MQDTGEGQRLWDGSWIRVRTFTLLEDDLSARLRVGVLHLSHGSSIFNDLHLFLIQRASGKNSNFIDPKGTEVASKYRGCTLLVEAN